MRLEAGLVVAHLKVLEALAALGVVNLESFGRMLVMMLVLVFVVFMVFGFVVMMFAVSLVGMSAARNLLGLAHFGLALARARGCLRGLLSVRHSLMLVVVITARFRLVAQTSAQRLFDLLADVAFDFVDQLGLARVESSGNLWGRAVGGLLVEIVLVLVLQLLVSCKLGSTRLLHRAAAAAARLSAKKGLLLRLRLRLAREGQRSRFQH